MPDSLHSTPAISPDNHRDRADEETFAMIRRELFTAVIGDVMDAAGLTSQFLSPQLRPLRPDMIVVGRAMPVLEADCGDPHVAHEGAQKPFGLMMEALDDLKPGEIYICSGASPRYALWGALMSARAIRLGAAGAVVDGYSRDTREVAKLPHFPTFSWGSYGQDQGVRGRVIDYRCTIRFSNGTVVRPGDLIVGDIDGVLAVPSEHAAGILAAAAAKVRGENKVQAAIEAGMSAKHAYDTFGIM
ncbi:RraA family protein [Kribbella sp. NPDC050820]|uniref:RraA family protein n=1 Tax=Kribbella sp. NPDC050820 TaxID=3155408 RepID=UPI0033EC9BA9